MRPATTSHAFSNSPAVPRHQEPKDCAAPRARHRWHRSPGTRRPGHLHRRRQDHQHRPQWPGRLQRLRHRAQPHRPHRLPRPRRHARPPLLHRPPGRRRRARHSQPPLLVPQQTFSAPRLYLASGVTTLRTTGSVETYTDLNLRREIDALHLPGPHLDVTGPYLEGAGSPFIQMHNLTGPRTPRPSSTSGPRRASPASRPT